MRIRCKEIYTEQGCIDGVLQIEHGKIKSITRKTDEMEIDFDAKDYRILPGIIDIHTHGYQGCNAQSVDKQELLQLKENMAKAGVTSFVPTAGEHFPDEYENLSLLAEVIETQTSGARMLGIHMEGPFLNPNRRGAFTKDQLLNCDIQLAKRYIEASKNHIIYVSLAPELDPDGEMITYLTSQGIVVAGGHTAASFEEYTKGITYGIKASTHTGNGMKQIDRRDVGALGAALLSDIYSEVICDFHHICEDMLELMFRVKPKGMEDMIMISDSGHLSGNPPGVYEKYGQVRIIDENGLIHLEDGTIAGSSHNVLYGIKNLEQKLQKDMNDIVKMCSLNPAKLLGFEDKKGSLKEGKDADFIIIDHNYEVIATYLEGQCIYAK